MRNFHGNLRVYYLSKLLSDVVLLDFLHTAAKIPRLHIIQHIKSIITSKISTPAIEISTMLTDEIVGGGLSTFIDSEPKNFWGKSLKNCKN